MSVDASNDIAELLTIVGELELDYEVMDVSADDGLTISVLQR